MDRIVIHGGRPLKGEIAASGAKNAALPMMVATLLAEGTTQLRNVPRLKDIETMAHLLRVLGARVDRTGDVLAITTHDCTWDEAPYELVKTMRASVYVLGPLIARLGRARVSLPGGCALGPRPIDLHIKGLRALGAEIVLEHGYVIAKAGRLRGARVYFDISSVGGTANVMMAAVLARGTTELANAACEPEIVALADLLNLMGAHIQGAGTGTITIEGVDALSPVETEVIPDRIETGTLAIAAAMTGGDVRITRCVPRHLGALTAKLEEAGVRVEESPGTLRVFAPDGLRGIDITTLPYPGFPTDLQAQMMSLATRAEGVSRLTETIFPERFNHVPELRRMGADIALEGTTAVVRQVRRLMGAQIMASDLRGSAALVLAGLVADGETDVNRVYHLDRGYEQMVEKLSSLGAVIERVPERAPAGSVSD